MLRCRRCRKGVIDSTCLVVEESIESSAVCCIWHVNVDMLPEWILTSVHQSQWTVGKLNCQHCRARLGGFNFISRSECPCGRDTTIHLNKSRVDQDHKHHVLIVQPRKTRSEKELVGVDDGKGRHEFNGTSPDSLHFNPAGASSSLTDGDGTFHFNPLYCISQRRKCSLENNATFKPSCFCPAGLQDESAFDFTSSVVDGPVQTPLSFPTRRQFNTDAEASFRAVACRPPVSGERQSVQEMLRNVQDVEYSAEATAVREDVLDLELFCRRTFSDSAAEQHVEVLPQASHASNRLSKREKNHLKSLRRKQKRRERWLHSQLEREQGESVSDSVLDRDEEDREGLTCAVCLDVYFNPYVCHPCRHVFCEPCLRTLARNRPTNTPCPLCRTFISHTDFHKELNHTAKTFFPKVFCTRKQNFQNAPCAKWPLPSSHKRFPPFWGHQRPPAMARRRWHFIYGGFNMHTLDFTDMRGWLFDIGLVIIYIHSFNWIVGFFFVCFLMYYFIF